MDSLQRFSRKCCVSGRDLIPGDSYVSELLETVEGIQRRDFAEEHWTGESDETICWWRAQIPLPSEVQLRWAPDRVLRSYFQALHERSEWATLNVLAMAMVRRRLMNLAYRSPAGESTGDASEETSGSEAEDANLRELILTDRQSGDNYELPEVDLSQVNLAKVEAALQEHLFTDQVEWEDETEDVDD